MNKHVNVWSERYAGFEDLRRIRQLTRIAAKPVERLDSSPPALAEKLFEDSLRAIFLPDDASCEVISAIAGDAFAHAVRYYASPEDFIRRTYLDLVDIPPVRPVYVSGLPGSGKSEIRKACERVFTPMNGPKTNPRTIAIDEMHPNFPLLALYSVAIESKASIAEVLRGLAAPMKGKAKVAATGLPEHCANWQYRCGNCLGLFDEMQFFSLSPQATTLLTRLVLDIGCVRIPHFIFCNYSLGHRLGTRRGEERDRLTGRVHLLVPPTPDSDDWMALLKEFQVAVGSAFDFKLPSRAGDLWKLSAGMKRKLVLSLCLAYRNARRSHRKTVGWSDVEAAYQSDDFRWARQDVEALVTYGPASLKLRDDLRCPYRLPPGATQDFANALQSARAVQVQAAAADAALTHAERSAKNSLEKPQKSAGKAKQSKRPGQSIRARTLSSMREAAERFKGTPPNGR